MQIVIYIYIYIYSLPFIINIYLLLGMSIGRCSFSFNENSKPMYPVHVSITIIIILIITLYHMLLQLSLFPPITICKHMMLLAISLASQPRVEKMGISIVTVCEDLLAPQRAFLRIDRKILLLF